MVSEEFFRVSLIVYAIVVSLFFITAEVIAILVFIRLRKILNNIEKLSGTASEISEEIKNKIETIGAISSLKQLIGKYFRKE